jgi:hypothetical protein
VKTSSTYADPESLRGTPIARLPRPIVAVTPFLCFINGPVTVVIESVSALFYGDLTAGPTDIGQALIDLTVAVVINRITNLGFRDALTQTFGPLAIDTSLDTIGASTLTSRTVRPRITAALGATRARTAGIGVAVAVVVDAVTHILSAREDVSPGIVAIDALVTIGAISVAV